MRRGWGPGPPTCLGSPSRDPRRSWQAGVLLPQPQRMTPGEFSAESHLHLGFPQLGGHHPALPPPAGTADAPRVPTQGLCLTEVHVAGAQ